MARPVSLEAQINAAQSNLAAPGALEARQLEWAHAATCGAVAAAMAVRHPTSAAAHYESAAGMAIFAGSGSPLTQGMAMGLRGPVTATQLDSLEAQLCHSPGDARQLEVTAFSDPSLLRLLAERGYRVTEWQLVWTRAVPQEPAAAPPTGLMVRRMRPGEEELYCRVALAGALETEDVPTAAIELVLPTTYAEGHEMYLAWLDDEAIGAATVCFADGVAFVMGSGVRPAFRGRGAQGALIRARLSRARELGYSRACSNTQPGTASRRNLERHGFSVAYPKLVLRAGD
ncbi:MAG: GNAT family N-acetyltransferase [Myxococcales bacterium]|nr:MAG: GNAT family N-acetyltransferase [Myxococcales bacterium]